MSARDHALPLLVLAIPPLLLLASPIAGRSLIVPYRAPTDAVMWDAVQQDTPWKIEAQRAFRDGHVPLYSFGAFSGSPLLANDQSAALYPGNACYLLTSAVGALAPTLALHLVIGAWGAYALVRLLGGSAAGGVVAGASFSLSGTMMAFLPHPQMTATLAIAPWVLWALRRSALRPTGARVALAAALVALQILAGHLQYAALTWIAALVLIVSLDGSRLLPLTSVGLGAGLGAVQLLPTLEYAVTAARKPLAVTGGFFARFAHSLPLSHLPTLVLPEIFGNPEMGAYSGRVNFRMFCAFVGLVPIALLFGASFRRRESRIFAGIALGGLLLAMGTPPYGLLNALPGWSSLKPARCIALFTLGATIAAGLAMSESWSKRRASGIAALLLMACVAGVGFPPDSAGILRSALAIGAFALVQTLRPKLGPALVAAIVVLELATFARPFARGHKVVDPYPESAITTSLRATGLRFSSTRFSVLMPNTAMAMGLEDARGTDSFIPRRYHELAKKLDPASDDMVRVKLSSGADRPAHALLAPVRVEPVRGALSVQTDPRSPPIAFFPARPREVRDLDEALTAVMDPRFVPASDAVVEGVTPGSPGAIVRSIRRSWNRITVETDVRSPSLLVVLQGFQPGWIARGSRGSYPVRPADVAFMGVVLPPGESRVELRYAPMSFRLGLFLTCFCGLLALVIAASSSRSGGPELSAGRRSSYPLPPPRPVPPPRSREA